MIWLDQWWFERVLADRTAHTGRYPMYAATALGEPCPLPWSAVLGARQRHETRFVEVYNHPLRADQS